MSDFARVRATPGLKGVFQTLRLYYRRRDVWSLTDEMRERSALGYVAETNSLWQRWQRNRFHLQLGRFDSTAIFRAYYGDDPRPLAPVVGDGQGPGDGGAGGEDRPAGPLRPYRRHRASPLARLLLGRPQTRPALLGGR